MSIKDTDADWKQFKAETDSEGLFQLIVAYQYFDDLCREIEQRPRDARYILRGELDGKRLRLVLNATEKELDRLKPRPEPKPKKK